MTRDLKVEPVEGVKLPLADNPAHTINGTTVVPDTAYYRRALARGAIKLATTPTKKKSTKSAPKKKRAEAPKTED